jgi:hypothetical protein
MRRLPRILLNAATVLSLVLCVAAGMMWVLSNQKPIVFVLAGWEVQAFGGHIRFLYDGTFQDGENSIPFWGPLLSCAMLPGARLAGWRRRARRLRMRPSVCRHCGYDCRATPDRCPECGMAMPQAKQI